MVDVATLTVNVDTTDVADGQAALQGLATTGARVETQLNGTGAAAQRAGRTFAASSGGIRQVSLQLSQVVQQAQAGGGILRALAIQLPDIGLAFGTIGIAAGIAGGALLSVASGFLEAGDEAEGFEDALETLKELMGGLRDTTDILNLSTDELVETYGRGAETIRKFALAQAEIQASLAGRRLEEQVSGLNDLIQAYEVVSQAQLQQTLQFVEDEATASVILGAREAKLQDIADEFGITTAQAERFSDVMRGLGDANGAEEIEAQLNKVVDLFDELQVPLDALPEELQVAVDEMITLQRETELAEVAMRNLSAAAAGVTVGVPLFNQGFDDLTAPDSPVTIDDPETPGRGRRGGGGVDRFAADLERLQQSLMTERELLDQAYFENLEILEDRRTAELLGEQEQRELLLEIERQYQSDLLDIQNSEADARLGAQSEFFGAMAVAAAVGGEKLARVAKVVGAVEATINAYRAAAQALADPSVPFWGKAAAYATVLATGLGAVSAIRGTSTGGVGAIGGGGGVAAAAAAPVQPATPSTYYNVTLQGEGSVSNGTVRELLEAINEEISNGGQIAGITVA